VQRLTDLLGDSWYAGFVGAPDKVTANLLALAHLGIDRLQVGSAVEGTYPALAAYLGGETERSSATTKRERFG
jgi:hypothetical protein